MKSLRLSEMESKERRIVWSRGGKRGMVDPQAIKKLMSDKHACAEGLANLVGRIWCPMWRLSCKDLGESKGRTKSRLSVNNS